jgi:hypothetical protein
MANLRYYPGMSEGLEESHRISDRRWSLGQDLNLKPPEYEAGILLTMQP